MGTMPHMQESGSPGGQRAAQADEEASRMEIKKVEVWKDSQLVCDCDLGVKRTELQLEGLPKLTLFSLPKTQLHRRFIFEHLHGRPLSEVFNGAGLRVITDEGVGEIEPLLFVHGRSESIRGNTTVNAVVLAYPHDEYDLKVFVSKVPEIYKRFTLLI